MWQPSLRHREYGPTPSKPLFEVRAVEVRPQRRLMSWKNRIPPLWVTGRLPENLVGGAMGRHRAPWGAIGRHRAPGGFYHGLEPQQGIDK